MHSFVEQQLIQEENIRRVVSMNEHFELQFGVANAQTWRKRAIEFMQLPVADIFHSPDQEKLQNGVDFILSTPNSTTKTIVSPSPTIKALLSNNEIDFGIRLKNNGMFLDDYHQKSGQEYHKSSVYVHCKAGRTRSATLVACYLIKKYNLTPEEAVAYIVSRRAQVLLHKKQWQAIRQFYQSQILHRQVESLHFL